MPEEEPVQIAPKPGMTIRVIETEHTTVMRQAAPAEEVTVCCIEFAEEFGKAFRLLPGGGLAPESLRLYRVRLGQEYHDRPKAPWNFCPCCGLPIATEVVPVVQTVNSEQ